MKTRYENNVKNRDTSCMIQQKYKNIKMWEEERRTENTFEVLSWVVSRSPPDTLQTLELKKVVKTSEAWRISTQPKMFPEKNKIEQ